MGTHRNLRVLDAARSVADTVQQLLRSRRGVLNAEQLGRAANSIPANIAEAFGRDPGSDRNRLLGSARSSAEETNEHWCAAFAADDLQPWVYWPIHHRLVTIVRTLNSSMRR
jgi:four helix bundle protein